MLEFVKNIIAGKDTWNNKSSQKFDGPGALCVLLLEAAHADGECSIEEQEQLKSNLIDQFNIPARDIEELIENSGNKRKESVDIFRFTRYINNNFSKPEKLSLMQSVWSIILIDDHLESHEDHFAHKLANLLRLTHKELIDAKLAARRQLAA